MVSDPQSSECDLGVFGVPTTVLETRRRRLVIESRATFTSTRQTPSRTGTTPPLPRRPGSFFEAFVEGPAPAKTRGFWAAVMGVPRPAGGHPGRVSRAA
jgi:hypothetical protein